MMIVRERVNDAIDIVDQKNVNNFEMIDNDDDNE